MTQPVDTRAHDVASDGYHVPDWRGNVPDTAQPALVLHWGADSMYLASPALRNVRSHMAMKPTYRWADADILDASEEELGGCDRVRMGLFFTQGTGDAERLDWRYSRYDALNLMSSYGITDIVEPRWGPDGEQAIDLERTVPFTLKPGASVAFEFDLTGGPDQRLMVYAMDGLHGLRPICHTAPDGTRSYTTKNTSDRPVHLLVTTWAKDTTWQQARIRDTSTDMRVRGLKYYELAFDDAGGVPAARVFVRFWK